MFSRSHDVEIDRCRRRLWGNHQFWSAVPPIQQRVWGGGQGPLLVHVSQCVGQDTVLQHRGRQCIHRLCVGEGGLLWWLRLLRLQQLLLLNHQMHPSCSLRGGTRVVFLLHQIAVAQIPEKRIVIVGIVASCTQRNHGRDTLQHSHRRLTHRQFAAVQVTGQFSIVRTRFVVFRRQIVPFVAIGGIGWSFRSVDQIEGHGDGKLGVLCLLIQQRGAQHRFDGIVVIVVVSVLFTVTVGR